MLPPGTSDSKPTPTHADHTAMDLDDHEQLGASDGEHDEPSPDTWQELADWIDVRGRMTRDPYRVALLAVGVGFVASGALFSSFTLKVLRVGACFALVPYVEARIRDALDET